MDRCLLEGVSDCTGAARGVLIFILTFLSASLQHKAHEVHTQHAIITLYLSSLKKGCLKASLALSLCGNYHDSISRRDHTHSPLVRVISAQLSDEVYTLFGGMS